MVLFCELVMSMLECTYGPFMLGNSVYWAHCVNWKDELIGGDAAA
jgi:hypothetical protein